MRWFPRAESGSAGRDPEWDQAGTASCRAHPSPANLTDVSTRECFYVTDLDPCGHHMQICTKRASFLAAHQIWQAFWTLLAAIIPGVKVVTTTSHGLPH